MSHRDARIEHYLDQVCRQVKAREVHPDLRDEIGSHLDEIFYERQQEGDTPEQAATYAIAQMGDPLTIGKSMHRLHRHRIHWGVVLGVLALFSVGLLLMWIYATRLAVPTYEGLYVNYLAYSGIGIIGLFFCMFYDYRKWKKAAWGLYILIIVLLWINPFVTTVINSSRFVILPLGFSIDLSTAASWILPLSIGAIMLDKLQTNRNIKNIILYVGLVSVPLFLFVHMDDWVRAGLFGVISLVLFGWITKKWIMSMLAGLLSLAAIVVYLLHSNLFRRLERFMVVMDLQNDPLGNGYFNRSIINIVQSASWWGNGINIAFDQFKLRLYEYPGVLLIHTFGWIAGIALLTGIVWLLVSMLRASLQIKDRFGQMIIVMVTLMFAIQMLYSLALTTGWVPIFSITFPIIGYGGSRLIFEYAMIGLLLGVYRRKDTIPLVQSDTRGLTESK